MNKKRLLVFVCILLIITAGFVGFNYSHLSEKIRSSVTSFSQNCGQKNLKTYNYDKEGLNFQFCYPDTWSVAEETLILHQVVSLNFYKNNGGYGYFHLQTLPASLNTLKNGEGIFKPGIFPTNIDYSKVDKGNKDLILENTDSQVIILNRGSAADWNPPDMLSIRWFGQDPVRKNNTYEILYSFDENEDPAFILDISKTASIVSDSLMKNR